MAEMTPQQARFNQFLGADGHHFLNFKASSPANTFPDNVGPEPQFFQNNLVSDHRVLKHFQDDVHANIKVFYYQLLRTTFQVETEQGFNTSFMYNLIHIIYRDDFEILFTPETESQRDLYNNYQFKKFFADFISFIQNEDTPNVEYIINNYPIINDVLIHIFRTILNCKGVDYPFYSKVPTGVVFTELSTLLAQNVISYNSNCWKFDDSDMFCYEHGDNQLFLAYLLDGPEVPDEASARDSGGAYEYGDYNQYNSSTGYQPQASYQNYEPTNSYMDKPYDYNSSYQPTSSITPINYDMNSYQTTSSYAKPQYQSLSDMANRVVVAEPKHDIYQPPSRNTAPGNEVKQSMISVTYDFVDFTGATQVYKDKVPRRQLSGSNYHVSSLAQPSKQTSNKPFTGLQSYMNKPQDVSVLVKTSQADYFDSRVDTYKPSAFDTYINAPTTTSYAPIPSYTVPEVSLPIYTPPEISLPIYTPPEIQIPKYTPPDLSLPSYNPAPLNLNYNSDIGMYKSATLESSFRTTEPYRPQISITAQSTFISQPVNDTFKLGNFDLPSYQPKKLQTYTQKPLNQSIAVETLAYSRQEQRFDTGLTNLSTPLYVPPEISAATAVQINTAGDGQIGDYYNDFTADKLLGSVIQPHRSKVIQIKTRIRGWKRSNVSNMNSFRAGAYKVK